MLFPVFALAREELLRAGYPTGGDLLPLRPLAHTSHCTEMPPRCIGPDSSSDPISPSHDTVTGRNATEPPTPCDAIHATGCRDKNCPLTTGAGASSLRSASAAMEACTAATADLKGKPRHIADAGSGGRNGRPKHRYPDGPSIWPTSAGTLVPGTFARVKHVRSHATSPKPLDETTQDT